MARYSFLVVSTLFASSAFANFTFNTTFKSQNNGQISSPWANLQAQGASTACLDAFAANIDCNPILFNLSLSPATTLYTEANLNAGCETTCEASLAGFILKLFSVCKDEKSTVTLLTNQTPDLFMLRYYRAFCTEDLHNGTYCLTEKNPVTLDPADKNKADIAAACNDTCFQQNSAVQWKAYGEINSTSGIGFADVSKACPNVDISNFAVLQPLSEVASATATTSSSTVTASPTGTGRPSTTTIASTHTTTSAAAAASNTKGSDANALTRGMLPAAFAVIAVAIAI